MTVFIMILIAGLIIYGIGLSIIFRNKDYINGVYIIMIGLMAIVFSVKGTYDKVTDTAKTEIRKALFADNKLTANIDSTGFITGYSLKDSSLVNTAKYVGLKYKGE